MNDIQTTIIELRRILDLKLYVTYRNLFCPFGYFPLFV